MSEPATNDFVCVLTTIDSEDRADQIARGLVERRLAACVQVQGPIRSTYRWRGAIEQSAEWICVAKTTREKYQQVEDAIRQLHSYEEPEIVAVPLVAGSDSYLGWLRSSLE